MALLDDAIRQQLSLYPFALQPQGIGPRAPVDYTQQSIMNPAQQEAVSSDFDAALRAANTALGWQQEAISRATEPGATAMLGPRYGPLAANVLGMALPMTMGEPPVASITKEQRAAWEAENQAYRLGRRELENAPQGTYRSPPPGTRVYIRPSESFARARDPFHPYPGDANFNAVVIDPSKMPLADKLGWNPLTAEKQSMTPPSPDHLAVQFERPREGGSAGYWFWKHRDDLEVLPPKEEFPIGTKVKYEPNEFESPNKYWSEGVIAKPPPNAPPSPGPDYVWADISKGKPVGRMQPGGNIVRYKGGTWGGWFHKSYFTKQGK